MNRIWNVFLYGILLSLAVPASAQNSYLCAEDMITGFSFDRGAHRWQRAEFKAEGKFIIARASEPSRKWEVKETGSSVPVAVCGKDFDEDGKIRCVGIGKDFLFNQKSMRFLTTYTVGYWNENALRAIVPGRNEGDDTPGMAIGRCTAL